MLENFYDLLNAYVVSKNGDEKLDVDWDGMDAKNFRFVDWDYKFDKPTEEDLIEFNRLNGDDVKDKIKKKGFKNFAKIPKMKQNELSLLDPSNGDIVYDTNLKKVRVFVDGLWVVLAYAP